MEWPGRDPATLNEVVAAIEDVKGTLETQLEDIRTTMVEIAKARCRLGLRL
jgi:hypothetical protein